MDNFFKDSDNLNLCEQKLQNYLCENSAVSVRLGTLPITLDDLKHLTYEFIKSKEEITTIIFYRTIPLSLMVFYTFSMKYKDTYHDAIDLIRSYTLPQHHRRLYVDTFSNAISEFNLETFNINYTSFDGVKKLICTYAGC